MHYIIKLLGLLSISISLSSCQQTWYFTIKDIADPSHPVFCVSKHDNCKGQGLTFTVLDIDEVDNSGNKIKSMWVVEPRQNIPLKEVKYGVTPAGWKEIVPAQPLEVGKYYSIHGTYFFRFKIDGGKIKSEVYTHYDFYKSK